MGKGVCILVFGVSGVGKTSSCADYVARHPEWLHLRASALLSGATGESAEALRTSSYETIRGNQQLLGAALERARSGREAAPILIDAHAAIDNDSDLVPVPIDSVASLHCDGMILLELPTDTLAARRANANRPRPARSKLALDLEASLEADTVRSYAVALNIPLVCAKVGDAFRLDSLIDEIIRQQNPPAR